MNNWQTKKLEEICEKVESGEWGEKQEKGNFIPCRVIRGTDFLLVQNRDFSKIPIRFVEKTKLEKLKLHYGDILIEISGGSREQPTGRILFWDEKGEEPVIFSNFVKKIKVNKNKVYPGYFFRYWQFLYFKGRTVDYEERTTNIRNFKIKDFLNNEEIPVPPIDVQEKIVKILDIIQEAVEIQGKIIEKTKELKKSLMAELFKYGVPSFRKGRKLKKTEIGEIPENWQVVKFREIFSIVAGGDISKINFSPIKTNRFVYPIYSNTIEKKGLYGFSDTYQYESGCITVTARGTIGYAIPRFEKFNAIIRLLVLIPKIELDITFFAEFINEKVKIIFEGTSIPQLTVPKISSIKIPLPPLPEQREIAEILKTIDEKIEIEQKKKGTYEELFKTLLNKIMNQEIDVEKMQSG